MTVQKRPSRCRREQRQPKNQRQNVRQFIVSAKTDFDKANETHTHTSSFRRNEMTQRLNVAIIRVRLNFGIHTHVELPKCKQSEHQLQYKKKNK